MDIKQEKLTLHLKELAGDFLNRHSNRTSLITVSNVILSDDKKRVQILLSVLPKEKEVVAIDFANRLRGEFRDYIKEHSKIRVLPSVSFSLDIGEQNRQRVQQLLDQESEQGTGNKEIKLL